MAMGKRKRGARQSTMWIATKDLPKTSGHPFYERLNRILAKAGFDGPIPDFRRDEMLFMLAARWAGDTRTRNPSEPSAVHSSIGRSSLKASRNPLHHY